MIPPNLTVCRVGTPGHSATLLFVWPETLPALWYRRLGRGPSVSCLIPIAVAFHSSQKVLRGPRQCFLPPTGVHVPCFLGLCPLLEAPLPPGQSSRLLPLEHE